MKKILQAGLGILVILFFAGCPNPDGGSGTAPDATEDSGFSSASSPGASGILTLTDSLETLTMIYANDSTDITFPIYADDSGSATLTTKFFMGETEVTNAVMAAVLQWAYDNERFSSSIADHNGINLVSIKHGGQQLLDLDDPGIRISHDGSGSFPIDAGYEDYPATNVTWYGSVMLCNWLTEMRDGNTANVVYTDIDTDWTDDETTETVTRTGYRLPSSDEWEYAARYRNDNTNVYDEATYSNPWFTQGDSASGATVDYNDIPACQAVAFYEGSTNPVPSDDVAVKNLTANALGLYDMSGNVWEWCFTERSTSLDDRVIRGASWQNTAGYLRVGMEYDNNPAGELGYLGFRLCRTVND